jgi:hypothetical protein
VRAVHRAQRKLQTDSRRPELERRATTKNNENRSVCD